MKLLKFHKFQEQPKANITLNLLSLETNLHKRELTAEQGKDRKLIMYPNCNIGLKWSAQLGQTGSI